MSESEWVGVVCVCVCERERERERERQRERPLEGRLRSKTGSSVEETGRILLIAPSQTRLAGGSSGELNGSKRRGALIGGTQKEPFKSRRLE